MALSLLCGGLGVAEAAVRVNDDTSGAYEVLTKQEVTDELDKKVSTEVADLKYAKTSDVYTRTDANEKFATKTELGSYAKSTDVYSKTDADDKFATNDALNDLKDTVNGKADKSYVDTEVGKKANKATTLEGYGITNAYTKDEVYNREEVARKLDKKADQTALDQATGKINDQQTAIDDLKKKTTQISYADGDGTTISGVRITDGNIVGNGNSAITQLANVETDKIKTDSINGKSLTGTTVATEKEVKDVADAVKTETDERKAADTALEEKITKNTQDIATLDGKVTTAEGNITDLKKKDTELEGRIKNNEGNIETNKNAISDIKQRTAGIDRIDATNETTIEGNVTVDNLGNVKAKGGVTADGKLKGAGVDAGDGAITTTGAVNAGSLNVENASTLKGDVTMNQKLSVTGDTSLGKTDVGGALNVTGASDLKNTTVGGTLDVTGATTLKGTLTAKENATFEKNVTVEKDLTVNGKLNVDKISMKNDELKNGKKHDSATTITADEISNLAKVTEQGNTTESQFTHNEKGTFNHAKDGNNADWKESNSNVTADGVSNKMEDSAGNTHTYYQTATETKEQLVNGNKSNFEKKTAEGNTISIKDKDADGNKKSLTNKQTVDGEKTSVTNKDSSSTINQGADQIRNYVASTDGTKSSTEVKADGITNTSDGTIINDAKDIVNNATGDMTNTVGGKLTTTVTGAAEETYKSGLKTDITGDETHTVTGKQTNTVKGGQENNISGGQKNNILTGDQETTVSNGSIINKAEHGDISNTAKNVTNEGTESVTNKVGNNEVKVSQNGVDIKAGDMTVTTDKTTGTTFGNGTPNDTTVINGGTIGTNKVNANETNTKKLTAGAAAGADGGRLTVDATDGVKGSYKSDKYTSKSYILPNTLNSGVDNDKKPTDADFVGSRTDHYMEGDKAKLDETVKDADGSNVTNKTSTGTVTTITDGTTTTKTEQTDSMVQSYVGKKDGSATNVTTNFANASANMVTEDGKTSTVLNNKDGLLVRNTANGKSFNTADGTNTGTALEWTNVKGNEISTGKVEANYVKMDYADVMQDLGVRGNAKIAGKTTTGSLEVTGTSTLTGDVTMGSNATVNGNFNVKGDTNLKNTKVDGTLNVTQRATFDDSVSIAKDLSVGGDVTASSYKVGDKTYISATGINANDQKITNVADGSISEGSKDAVNGGQLYNVKNDLEGKVNKVGANAAAMANLHPMEFDPDSKWNIAAAIGNYGSETAAALGAFYRPNDDVMVNLSTAFGTGENMVGGGVSVRLGKGGNKLSREESNALKDQVNDLTARMDALLSVLNPNMSKDFPDVPENHWAYEAVSRLAGNDIVQGYPDGEFHGERTMTRYEMAEIIYNALSRGAEAEKELVEEFKPELQAMAASEKATAERAEG